MELKELVTKTLELFAVPEPSELPNALYRICLDGDTARCQAFVELVGDLNTDWLQMIWQYYLADREKNKQDYTPKSICALVSRLTDCAGGTVYDLCAGSGALTIQKWAQNGAEKTYICEELDERVIPMLIFNMVIRNIDGYVINRNALTLETSGVWRIRKGDRFSSIEKMETAPMIVADEIISNPPYNIKWDAPEPLTADDRFFMKPIPPASNANYAFVLSAVSRMTHQGRCAFVLPAGVLSGAQEQEIREYLIDSGLLECVISLPDRMFESTSIGTCILVFSRGNSAVKMFDLRKKAMQEQRDQNGQFGGASHERRTYHKIVNVLPDDAIDSVCGECNDIPGFSKTATPEEIKANGFILVPSRYIRMEEQEHIHRPYADIMADINRISRERSAIKITCNETLAKQLGLHALAQQVEQEDGEALNRTFALLGGKYERKKYISLTKNKNGHIVK